MKKVVARLVLVMTFMFASIANANVILSLDPGTQDSVIGDLVSVSVMIDGLGDGVPLSLASFDIDVAFDTSALTFMGYSLFDNLGVVDFFEADDFSMGEYTLGIVNIFELSYLSNFDLWGFQPGSFALAELFFVADTAVISAISFASADLADVNGDVININAVNDASVTAVPTPASSILIFLGLLSMFVRKKSYSSGNRS
ncbi:MAG: hypothetical protein JKX67_08905 [Colwellia sp.]|nr:hypothetical protein [Colwellia sp.]